MTFFRYGMDCCDCKGTHLRKSTDFTRLSERYCVSGQEICHILKDFRIYRLHQRMYETINLAKRVNVLFGIYHSDHRGSLSLVRRTGLGIAIWVETWSPRICPTYYGHSYHNSNTMNRNFNITSSIIVTQKGTTRPTTEQDPMVQWESHLQHSSVEEISTKSGDIPPLTTSDWAHRWVNG